MASLKESLNVEKLNQNNYSVWKFKIEMLLIKEDLYEHITDDPPEPVTNEWNKKDQKARALINLCIDDNQIVYVKNETTARTTWDALRKIHERSNLSSKLYLLRKLYSTKLEEGGNMINHIIKILETTDKLKAIGEEINDSHLSALLLCSLPPSYDTLITALEARPETELSPEFIKGKLTDEYHRRIENSGSSCENGTRAYKTNGNKFYTKRENNKFCTYCHKKNHEKSECWYLKNKHSNFSKQQPKTYAKYKQNSSLCFETNQPSSGNKSDDKKKLDRSSNLAFCTNKAFAQNWIIDSGSSSHICNNKLLFTDMKNDDRNSVTIANGNILNSYGSGSVELKTKTSDGKINNITLKDVLYVPDIESNLMSVRKATQNGCSLIFDNEGCKLKYDGKIFLEGKTKNNLYEVVLDNSKFENYAQLAHCCHSKNCIELWHKRLGHKNMNSIKEIVSKKLATGLKLENCTHDTTCESCIKSKLTDAPYPKQTKHRTKRVLELVHSDICGPIRTPTIGGKTYFLTFIDDFSRYTIIYLLSKKSEFLTKLKEYIAMTKNKFGRVLQTLRSDNGGEYTSKEVENFLREKGIQHQLTVPHCPSQNGVAERKNRTLLEMTRCLLSESNLEQKFWGEAINTATYLQNRLPTKSNEVTPYQLWNNNKPDLSHIKVFGCKAYAYVNKTQRGKLDDKATEGIFVGYDYRSKGYRIYTAGKSVILARTVKFIENTNPKKEIKENLDFDLNEINKNTSQGEPPKVGVDASEININLQEINEDSDVEKITLDLPRRSERSNKGIPPDRFAYITNTERIYEPKSWKELESLKNPNEKFKWLEATNEEINSLNKNKTWELVTPPPGKKIIGCKWTFKAKYNSNGEIENYKARLVAKGFSQKFGTDYDETFAPVVTYTTIRTFLASAAYKNLNVKHIDIKTAFLHGDLDEDVYMSQPEGYIEPGEESKVCKLKKAIYGLKQAARAWNIKIATSLKKIGFEQSSADPCLFKCKKGENTIYIIVYVDDLLISGKNKDIQKVIEELKLEYEVKDLGQANYYLGINIEKTKEGNFELDQRNKINEIIEKFNLVHAKPCDTPMEPGYLKLEDDENLLPDNTKYRQAVGALLYLATVTRPDISAAVNILSRRNEKPREKDWNAVKRVIKYLRTTRNLKLIISKEKEPILTSYADADWAGDISDRKSTSGNLFKLGETSIFWITKKQNSVALSSAEAEYVSVSSAAQEIIWLQNLLTDLDLPQKKPIILYEDNQSCIKMVQSDKHHSKTKHIDIKLHSIKNLKETGIIDLEYCPSNQMTADLLTKPLPRPDFRKHRDKLGLCTSISEIEQGY